METDERIPIVARRWGRVVVAICPTIPGENSDECQLYCVIEGELRSTSASPAEVMAHSIAADDAETAEVVEVLTLHGIKVRVARVITTAMRKERAWRRICQRA